MKCSIRKKDYLKIYNLTNNASPLGDFNCGELCNSICCTVENGERNDVLEEMVLYLLPGEEEMLENESDWFEMLCRSFPLSPHFDKDNNLHLIYDVDDMTYQCPIIAEKMDLDEDFLKKIYKMWKRLTEDKLIFDLVKMDSLKREKNKIDYKIVF